MSPVYQWRGYPWPHCIEGNGGKIGTEAYPFQGLDVATREYDYEWLREARYAARAYRGLDVPVSSFGRRMGDIKHPGRTPLGTPVAALAREAGDILTAPCGLCGRNLGVCKCGMEGAT